MKASERRELLRERAAGVFAAIDFETATGFRDSACSVAAARFEDGVCVASGHWLVRPPREDFTMTAVHGLTWEDVKGAPLFAQVWPRLRPLLTGCAVVAAHNAGFDRSVLVASAAKAGVKLPGYEWVCTVKLARSVWGWKKADLATVSRRLRIPLKHHDAMSDARAAGEIVLKALERGGPDY